jgi:RHS repeat-associated protein
MASATAQVAYDDGAGGETIDDVHTDHLDTPRMLTDAGGTPVWRAAPAAYGAMQPDEDPDGDTTTVTFNLRFPGHYYDKETEHWDPALNSGAGGHVAGTGLHYNRMRYYDPGIGRYVSADPIGQDGGINLYSYANDAPAVTIDSDGLSVRYSIYRVVRSLRDASEHHYLSGGSVSRSQVLDAVSRGGVADITGPSAAQAARRLARQVARQTDDEVLHHGAHHPTSPRFRPHYQLAKGKGKGKIFYGLLATATTTASFFLPEPVQAAQLVGNGVIAGVDALMNAGTPVGMAQPCYPGGPPGGDELYGQFTGSYGWLNRLR